MLTSVPIAFYEIVLTSVPIAFYEIVLTSVPIAFYEIVLTSVPIAFYEIVLTSVPIGFNGLPPIRYVSSIKLCFLGTFVGGRTLLFLTHLWRYLRK